MDAQSQTTPPRFTVEHFGDDIPPHTVALRASSWNDWFEFRTTFIARYVDAAGDSHRLGEMKIADIRHTYSNEAGAETPMPDAFTELDRRWYVSLGQTERFYERVLNVFGAEVGAVTLHALGDLAEDPSRLDEFRGHRVVSESLMREVAAATIRNKLHRIALGMEGNEGYNFRYVRPQEDNLPLPDTVLDFEVVPNSYPPTNVHALIGRNGSGKTTLLRSMAKAMLGKPIAEVHDGRFETDTGHPLEIANLVYVSFSAFDKMELPVLDKQLQWAVPYSYVGLQYPMGGVAQVEGMEELEDLGCQRATITADELEASFADSAVRLMRKDSRESWARALETLESDPNFNEAEVLGLADPGIDLERLEHEARLIWNRLSTGHKIVLLTITRLVEAVVERTLVLIDEPEAHLHPPLLSALIRAISDLLQERNGVALVATHSPVVLQEIPRSCASKVRRSGLIQKVERPSIETFGESVGVLTTEVFSLEVSASGYHNLLTESALESGEYESVLKKFDNQIGFEGRAILASWFAARRSR